MFEHLSEHRRSACGCSGWTWPDPMWHRGGVGCPGRKLELVTVEVVRTDPQAPLGARLAAIDDALSRLLAAVQPDQVAVERVFSQHNVRTVMGTAQVAGVCMLAAHRRGLPRHDLHADRGQGGGHR